MPGGSTESKQKWSFKRQLSHKGWSGPSLEVEALRLLGLWRANLPYCVQPKVHRRLGKEISLRPAPVGTRATCRQEHTEVGEGLEMDSQHDLQECRTSPTKPRWRKYKRPDVDRKRDRRGYKRPDASTASRRDASRRDAATPHPPRQFSARRRDAAPTASLFGATPRRRTHRVVLANCEAGAIHLFAMLLCFAMPLPCFCIYGGIGLWGAPPGGRDEAFGHEFPVVCPQGPGRWGRGRAPRPVWWVPQATAGAS